MPAQPKGHIGAHAGHDHLVVWVLEDKGVGRGQGNGARVGLQQAGQGSDQGGLAAPIGAQEHVQGAALDLQRQVVQHLQRACEWKLRELEGAGKGRAGGAYVLQDHVRVRAMDLAAPWPTAP